MSEPLIHDVLADLQDVVDALREVHIPDWLDGLEHPDWEALDALQHLSKTIHKAVMAVCDEYRIIAHNSRYADSGMNGAPPGSVTPPWPGG